MKQKFQKGNMVRDRVTGIQGMVIDSAKFRYKTRYHVQPEGQSPYWVDDTRLELTTTVKHQEENEEHE